MLFAQHVQCVIVHKQFTPRKILLDLERPLEIISLKSTMPFHNDMDNQESESISFETSVALTKKATENIIKTLASSNPRLRPRYDRYDLAVAFRPCSDFTHDPHECLESLSVDDFNIVNRIYRAPRVPPTSADGWRDSAAAVPEADRFEGSPSRKTRKEFGKSEDIVHEGSQKCRQCPSEEQVRVCSDRAVSSASCSSSFSASTASIGSARFEPQRGGSGCHARPAAPARPRRLWARLLGCLGAH